VARLINAVQRASQAAQLAAAGLAGVDQRTYVGLVGEVEQAILGTAETGLGDDPHRIKVKDARALVNATGDIANALACMLRREEGGEEEEEGREEGGKGRRRKEGGRRGLS
jgi:hypothetical protein